MKVHCEVSSKVKGPYTLCAEQAYPLLIEIDENNDAVHTHARILACGAVGTVV